MKEPTDLDSLLLLLLSHVCISWMLKLPHANMHNDETFQFKTKKTLGRRAEAFKRCPGVSH